MKFTKFTKFNVPFVLTTALTVMLLVGCEKIASPTQSVVATPSVVSTPEVVSKAPEIPKNLNPLTGVADLAETAIGKRPVSFMINNSHSAWPQMGISQADIIYEWPYEGSATRMMAVFSDYTKAPAIGPLRSVRHDFVELSIPFHTLFVHWGGSYAGYDTITNNGVDHLDGDAGAEAFYRDQGRLDQGSSLEHTAMANTAFIPSLIVENGFEMNFATPNAYTYSPTGIPAVLDDPAGRTLDVELSNDVFCNIRYDDATRKYSKFEFDEPQIDGNTNIPVQLDNVFLLFAGITQFGEDPILRDLLLEQGGTGYYMNGGTKTAISWIKPDLNSPMLYTVQSTGAPLTVNPGNSWVMFTYNENAPTAVFG